MHRVGEKDFPLSHEISIAKWSKRAMKILHRKYYLPSNDIKIISPEWW